MKKTKKLKKKKVLKLYERDYIEALDHTHLLISKWADFMKDSKVVNKNINVQKTYRRVLSSIWDLYQVIGRESANE